MVRQADVRGREHQRAYLTKKISKLWEHTRDGNMIEYEYKVDKTFKTDVLARQQDYTGGGESDE